MRYCMACDLKDEPLLIEEYKSYHAAGKAWPEITKSMIDSGIEDMEIYLIGNRLFMIMEVNDSFDFEAKNEADRKNTKVQEWEDLMWKYQKQLPWALNNEKWVLTERIYKLNE